FGCLRSGRFGWAWIVAVLFLTAGLLGDSLTIALGILPIIGAAAVASLRTRTWRAGGPEAGAALLALVLTPCLRQLAEWAGSFTIDSHHPIASAGQAAANLPHAATWTAGLLGVGSDGVGNGGVPAPLQATHVVGLGVVLVAVVLAAGALVTGAARGRSPSSEESATWRLDDLLVLAFASDLVVFVVLTTSDNVGYLRYLTGAVIFGAVLGARAVGGFVEHVSSSNVLKVSVATGIVLVASFAAGFGFTLSAPAAPRPYNRLGQFLEAHHLYKGLGDYWSASVTTVATGETVKVRPVVATPKGRVERYQRQSNSAWYSGSFEFLVYNTKPRWGGVDLDSATTTFGRVAHIYDVGAYRVLVWNHSIRVSSHGYANDADDDS
ncbi:MAG TPA: hypothetical protein VEJ87_02755, partial [Acidimicrobiales bacterium]|nr:hypothetical protein [Acidimicrobiales bacterium]